MRLVEAESEGPVEGDDALVTPPRPPHRRVSVSLVFTMSVLIGTVVTIYRVFPGDSDADAVADELSLHRHPPGWELSAPSAGELRAWTIGALGGGVPLPKSATITGVRRVEVAHRAAELIRFEIGGAAVSYFVQPRDGAPTSGEHTDGELRAIAWSCGGFACAAVGPTASADSWQAALK